jgi:hypothetical protein
MCLNEYSVWRGREREREIGLGLDRKRRIAFKSYRVTKSTNQIHTRVFSFSVVNEEFYERRTIF